MWWEWTRKWDSARWGSELNLVLENSQNCCSYPVASLGMLFVKHVPQVSSGHSWRKKDKDTTCTTIVSNYTGSDEMFFCLLNWVVFSVETCWKSGGVFCWLEISHHILLIVLNNIHHYSHRGLSRIAEQLWKKYWATPQCKIKLIYK